MSYIELALYVLLLFLLQLLKRAIERLASRWMHASGWLREDAFALETLEHAAYGAQGLYRLLLHRRTAHSLELIDQLLHALR